MALPITKKVTFKKLNVKALVTQLDGREPAYPVHRFGRTLKFERPEVPGGTYRWLL